MIGKNNVLNVRDSAHFSWVGQCGSTRGFCNFVSERCCRRVGAYLLMRSYRRAKCVTVADIIRRWAPPSENSTGDYIKAVCAMTGFESRFEPESDVDYSRLLAAMEIVEVGVSLGERPRYFRIVAPLYMEAIEFYKIKRI